MSAPYDMRNLWSTNLNAIEKHSIIHYTWVKLRAGKSNFDEIELYEQARHLFVVRTKETTKDNNRVDKYKEDKVQDRSHS